MTGEEVDYLLKSALDYFPAHPLTRSDVISTWTGLRPLMAPASDMSESNVSREHYINFIDPGLLIVAGGKLTTFRQMAEECVDRIVGETQKWATPLTSVLKKTLTKERPLPYIFSPSTHYSNNAESNFIGSTEAARMHVEEVEAILKTQCVFTLEDFMVRRTSIYYKEPQNGLRLLPQLKVVFQKVLSWNEEKWQSEVTAYAGYVDHHVTNVLKQN
jgi:glycerol-3-phosphate dehydrogenase